MNIAKMMKRKLEMEAKGIQPDKAYPSYPTSPSGNRIGVQTPGELKRFLRRHGPGPLGEVN